MLEFISVRRALGGASTAIAAVVVVVGTNFRLRLTFGFPAFSDGGWGNKGRRPDRLDSDEDVHGMWGRALGRRVGCWEAVHHRDEISEEVGEGERKRGVVAKRARLRGWGVERPFL